MNVNTSAFAITLQSSLAPIDADALPDLQIFREHPLYVTRDVENGRVRYRLRLGAFADARSAEKVAVTMREQFPAALTSQLSDCERKHSLTVRRWQSEITLDSSSRRRVKAATSSAAEHGGEGGSQSSSAQSTASQRTICAYALHLQASRKPLRGQKLPVLPILRRHYLYTIRLERDGASWYALRLGFFSTTGEAKHVAMSLHKDFPSVQVVQARTSDFRACAAARIKRSSKASHSPQQRRSNVERESPLGAESPAAAAKPSNTTHASAGPAASRVVSSPVPAARRAGAAAASEEYRVIRPSALLSYLLVAAALFSGWRVRGEQYLTAESGLGYGLGIIGGLMMLVLFLYPLRKKARFMRRLGPIKYWFKSHIVLGVLGPVLILFHANFGFGSINSRVALISTLLVAGSGFFGRYFYVKIHHGLYGRKATLQELQQQAEAIQHRHAALDLIPELHQRLRAIEEFVLHPPDGVIPNIGRPFVVAWKTRTAAVALSYFASRELKRKVAARELSSRDRKRLRKKIGGHISERLHKVRKVAEFTFYERLFSLWHILHYPLFVILVVAAFVHVFAVHVY